MATAKTPKSERLLNLVICLMSAKTYVTADYLRKNVVGYLGTEQTEDTFKRMLERDKNELRALGIPVETGTAPMGGDEGYRIKPENYALGDINLEADEAAVVAAAAAVWHEPEVAVESQTAVLKLKAAGLDVTRPEELGFGQVGGGRSIGDEKSLRALITATTEGRAVTFTHRTAGTTTVRTLEPWGLASDAGRLYVVGHDRDRGQTRTFRVSRITGVEIIGEPGSVIKPDDVGVRELVAAAVSGGSSGQKSTAHLWLARDRAHDLRRLAEELTDADLDGEPGHRAVVQVESRSQLVRAILAAGRDVVVLDPPDLRETVMAELDALAASVIGASVNGEVR